MEIKYLMANIVTMEIILFPLIVLVLIAVLLDVRELKKHSLEHAKAILVFGDILKRNVKENMIENATKLQQVADDLPDVEGKKNIQDLVNKLNVVIKGKETTV